MQYDLDGLYKNSVAYSLKRSSCKNVDYFKQYRERNNCILLLVYILL